MIHKVVYYIITVYCNGHEIDKYRRSLYTDALLISGAMALRGYTTTIEDVIS